MLREPSSRKVVVVVLAGLVAGVAIAYTVVASRAALREVRSERQIAETRRRPDELGYFSFLNPNHQPAIYPAPAAACSPEAMPDVERATADSMSDEPSPGAQAALEAALRKDPSCVAAARLLVNLLSRSALQITARRFVDEARARPEDPAAQLKAAYYARALGDGALYRRYLEAATALRPDQPLLHAAWSYYWSAFASPVSTARSLEEMRAEVESTGDVGAVAGLAATYVGLRDDASALPWCDRLYQALPDSRKYGIARECAGVALRARDPALERTYLERFWRAETALVSRACMHADLSWVYAEACRPDEALAEADTAIAQGCVVPGSGQRRRSLYMLGRFDAAAAPPPGGQYWSAPDRRMRALALAFSGQRQLAVRVADSARPDDDAGTSAWGTSTAERNSDQLFVTRALLASGAPLDALQRPASCERWLATEADRLDHAASGYSTALMLDEARWRIDRALQLEPTHAGALQSKVYLLSLEQRLDEAAQVGEQAIAAGATDAGLYRNLGYVYEQLGRCERAVPLYDRARTLAPLQEANYRNLAKCLDLLGRSAEADEVWAFVPGGRGERYGWWMLAAIVGGVVVLYLGGKLALIVLLPGRFGHLRFP